ncbi:MAG: hypothetical protein AAFQ68_29350, partial [Bacteroidota bacterium]
MPNALTPYRHLIAVLIWLPSMLSAQPVINQLIPLSTSVGMNQKFEVAVDLSATYTNPYDYDQIVVSAVFNGPNNESIQVDGFYMDNFTMASDGRL